MNHKTALLKTKAVPDCTGEAVEASEVEQVFFVCDTAHPMENGAWQ